MVESKTDNKVYEQIRELAEPLWESASRPYGMALDFWLMAEQMVLEMVAMTARMQRSAAEPPSFLADDTPIDRIRELAESMWIAAGRQYGYAQDFWLAAERHISSMMRASTLPDAERAALVRELTALPPGEYLDRVRLMAYFLWERAGKEYGRTLDFWLQAEREMLMTLARAAPAERDEQSGSERPARAEPSAPAAAPPMPDSLKAGPAPSVEVDFPIETETPSQPGPRAQTAV